jgi:hypothetical protein
MSTKRKCKPCRCGTAEGEAIKAQKLALLEARREVFVLRGRRALLRKMLDGNGVATADDVRAAVELPPGIDPRCLGSVPGRLGYGGIIGPDEFVRCGRPEGHARWIQQWRLKDRAAALRWVADHPDLPDPTDADQGDGKHQRVLFPTTQETATPTAGTAGAAL